MKLACARRWLCLWLALFFRTGQSRLRLLKSRRASGCPHDGDLICARAGVTILRRRHIDDGGKGSGQEGVAVEQRALRFGNECADETTVFCKALNGTSAEAGCSACGDCPCDYDASMATRTPYVKMMLEQMAPWCTQQSSPSRVLVIGLGGGELPQHLLHECPGMSLETVELNAQVIEMGRKYFGLREAEERFGSRLAIEESDALTGVKERVVSAPGRFDAVLVDCFGSGGEVPEDCRSRNFLAGVHELLRPRGVLLQNIWDWSIEKPDVVANAFWETTDTYRTVFGKSAFEDLQGPDVVHVLKATKAQALPALETDASEDVSDD